jgi:hypothetical protein
MKKLVILSVFVSATVYSFADDPENVLVKYDYFGDFGRAVFNAVSAKWPDANLTFHANYTWPEFIAGLTGGTDWDIVICEAHMYEGTETQYNALKDYFEAGGALFVCDYSWTLYGCRADELIHSMGVSSVEVITPDPVPHYTWDPEHVITAGITDWHQSDPGYIYVGHYLTVDGAVPVTGWTETETEGNAAICVLDGEPDAYNSVISGYFPSFKTDDAEGLWDNILDYMSERDTEIRPSSFGEIKAVFR